MNRVLHCLQLVAAAPTDVPTLCGEMDCTDSQIRATLANLMNRLMVRPVPRSRPKRYEATNYGLEHLETGVLKQAWNTAEIRTVWQPVAGIPVSEPRQHLIIDNKHIDTVPIVEQAKAQPNSVFELWRHQCSS